MWYVYDLRDYDNSPSTSAWMVSIIVLRNNETDDFTVLDLHRNCCSHYSSDKKLSSQYTINSEKCLKYLFRHRNKVLGATRLGRFQKFTENDIKLLDYIEKPKVTIRRPSYYKIVEHIRTDKSKLLFYYASLLELIKRKDCVDVVDKKYLYVVVKRFKYFEVCCRYRIKDYERYNRFITKCMVLERK